MAASDDFYTELLVDVNAAIDEFGTTYTVRGGGTYDENTHSVVSGVTRQVAGLVSTQRVFSAVAPIAFPVTALSESWLNKKTLILKAVSNVLPTEEILVEGVWFSLSKIVEIKPADITVLYMLDLTR